MPTLPIGAANRDLGGVVEGADVDLPTPDARADRIADPNATFLFNSVSWPLGVPFLKPKLIRKIWFTTPLSDDLSGFRLLQETLVGRGAFDSLEGVRLSPTEVDDIDPSYLEIEPLP